MFKESICQIKEYTLNQYIDKKQLFAIDMRRSGQNN